MRISSLVPQAAHPAGPRTTRRAANAPDRTTDAEPAPRAEAAAPATTSQLPNAVADRLAELLARDPGLAEAVSAQLPAARESARALAAYDTPGRGPHILDVSG